jgi:superfamily II DNA or RNA helicase
LFGKKDLGQVLRGKDDLFYAVQCKFRVNEDENTKLNWTKDKIGNFFGSTNSVSGYIVFSNAYAIDNVSSSRSQNFQFINISDLLELDHNFFDSVCNFIEGNKPRKLDISPRSHQIEAIKNASKYYSKNSRGKLILPCGAGKTITSLWISEILNSQLILIALPSLALVRQFKNEWKKYTNFEFDYVCVCSDEDVDQDEDIIKTKSYEVDIRTTNQPEIVLDFISKKVGKKIIFSTYQSVDKVVKAVKNSDIVFDLAIFDEAHRTAGVRKTDIKKTNYTIIHDDNEIKIKNRLYMTATPRVASTNAKTRAEKDDDVYLYCMDDENLYGKEFFRMSFAQAIEAGILVDYRIVAVGVEKQEISEYLNQRRLKLPNYSLDDIANNYALEHIMDKYNLKHAITFHTRVKYAENFKKIHKEISDKTNSFVVSGEDSTSVRNQILNSFKRSNRAVISNARCLTEGVDIPTIDMVFFCDPKNSKVDIVQAAGRALRKAEGKTLGYIIIPIYHSNKDGVEKVIDDSSFKRLTEVIKAISDHDDRLQEEIDSIAAGKKSFDSNSRIDIVESKFAENSDSKITVLNFGDELKKSIFTEIIEKTHNGWNFWHKKLDDWLKFKGNNSYPSKEENQTLYAWIMSQRTRYNKNNLSDEKISKLNQLNFVWDLQEKGWDDKYIKLIAWRKNKANHLQWPSQRSKDQIEHELGVWFLSLRKQYKDGIIKDERLKKLNDIGFPFEPQFLKWSNNYNILKNFLEKNKRFPRTTEVSGTVYIWLRSQVDKFDNLNDEQKKLLKEINYQDFNLRDEKAETTWNNNYEKLKTFFTKNKKLPNQKTSHVLYHWLLQQSNCYKSNSIDEKKLSLLFEIKEIELFFNIRADSSVKRIRFPDKSLKKVDDLVNFRKRNPDKWPSSVSESEDEKDLARFVQYIRQWKSGNLNRKSSLPEEIIKKLDQIGFDLGIRRRKGIWDINYNSAIAAITSKSIINPELHSWITHQKWLMRKGRLNADKELKIKHLIEIGKQIVSQ